MDTTTTDTTMTPAQIFIRGYGVPVALILTGVGLGWYLSRKAT